MSLDVEHGCSFGLRFREDVSSSLGKTTVDTTDSSLGTLDLTQVDRLQQTRISPHYRGITYTSSCWDNLTTSSVDSISVQSNIVDVDPDPSHVLFAKHTLVGSPLESSDYRVLDLVQVLHSLGDISDNVRSSLVGTETPDLTGIVDVPGGNLVVLLGKLFTDNPGR